MGAEASLLCNEARTNSSSMASGGFAAGPTLGGVASSSSLSIRLGLNRRLRPFSLGHSATRTRGLGDGSSSSHSAISAAKGSIAGMGSCVNASSHLVCSITNQGLLSGLDPPCSTPSSYEEGGELGCVAWRCSVVGKARSPGITIHGVPGVSPRMRTTELTVDRLGTITPGVPPPLSDYAPRPIHSLPHTHPLTRPVASSLSYSPHLRLLALTPPAGGGNGLVVSIPVARSSGAGGTVVSAPLSSASPDGDDNGRVELISARSTSISKTGDPSTRSNLLRGILGVVAIAILPPATGGDQSGDRVMAGLKTRATGEGVRLPIILDIS